MVSETERTAYSATIMQQRLVVVDNGCLAAGDLAPGETSAQWPNISHYDLKQFREPVAGLQTFDELHEKGTRRRVNIEQDSNWNLLVGPDRNAVGGALRRAIRVGAAKLPSDFCALLDRIDPRPANRRNACQEN